MAGAPIRDYRDLHAWQKAVELALLCEDLCDALPNAASHLSSQIRRAANSVHANIAEGNGRFSRPDYLRHLSIAHGSLRELEAHLYFVGRRYGSSPKLEEASALCATTSRLLAGLIRALRGKPIGK